MKLCMAPLFSSSSGNSIYIGSEKSNILIDAGVPGSKVESALLEVGHQASEIDAILVTHEHTDHIKGVGVLSRRYDIPIYANAKTWEQMEGKLGAIAPKNVRIFEESDFFIKDLCVQSFSVSHDGADTVGFNVFCAGKKVTVMTDTGKVTHEICDHAKGASIVLLESNHDVDTLKCGSYPYQLKMRILSGKGHLSNADAAKTAVKLAEFGVRGILLGHLSRQNNFDELAYETVYTELVNNGILPGRDVALQVAKKDWVSGLFEIK